MTRVVGRIGFVAVAFSLIAASSANALMPRLSDPALAAAIPGPGDLRTNTFSGSSNFDTHVAGATMNGQDGAGGFGAINNTNWRCLASTAVPPRCPDSPPGAVAAAPNGNGGGQAGLLGDNVAYPGGSLIGFRTPRLKNETQPEMNLDVRMDDNFGSNYYIGHQHIYTGAGAVASRVVFGYNGYMYALSAGAFVGPLENFLLFPFNTWFTMVLDYNYVAKTYTFSVGPDKQHLTLLHDATGNANFAFSTTASVADDLIFASDNFQNTGLGSFDGNPNGPGTYIDNLEHKPEPGTLAMLAVGALMALRRRR